MENVTDYSHSVQIFFSWYDYTLFSLMLGLSALIGIWFGFVKKQSTPDEYLLGGKEMKVVPIALSLIASYISGISLLGGATEVYRFGSTFVVIAATMYLSAVLTYYIYIPVFFNLQITSTYEYIELRFNAKMRTVASVLFTIATLLHMTIVIYIPALAFSQATGMDLHIVTVVVCAICIFYTTIGGLKAVVWTDTLQFGVMIGAIVGVFYMGLKSAGGFEKVWQIASEGGRVSFDFDWNPTKRDGFYAATIGTFFHTTSNIAINQGYIQKYLSLPTLKDIKWSFTIFIIGTSIIFLVTVFTGLIIYAKYSNCDPFTSGKITRQDQILPYYVLDVSQTIPGLAGLFLSGLFSAALSTLSSCLNCLSGTIYEDFISPFMSKDISKKTVSNILKLLVVLTGIVSTALVFIIERLGNVLPLQISLIGITGGPLLGVFTLGMLFPMANSKGAMVGSASAVLIMSYIIIQTQIYHTQGLLIDEPKVISIDGCDNNLNFTSILYNSSDSIGQNEENLPFFIFRLSHYYFTMMGCLLTLLVGVPVSWLFRNNDEMVSKDVISPAIYWALKTENNNKNAYYSVDKANTIVFTDGSATNKSL